MLIDLLLDAALDQAVDWTAFAYALALLVLAAGLLLLEFFVISFGLLLLTAIASTGTAIYFAFVANDVVGWVFVVVTPLLAAMLVRYGIRRVLSSSLVPHGAITAEAGYHHVTDELGITPGAQGVMVTPAHPSGRARFDGGECDVQASRGMLARDTRVTVQRIDGPIVFVRAIGAIDESDSGEHADC